MARFLLVITLVGCVAYAAGASAGCNWKKYDFDVDPGLDSCLILPDGSIHHYFPLYEPVTIPEDGYIAVRFILLAYNYGSLGHSSLMGPIAVDEPSCYPFVRLNLHYMQFTGPYPEFSIYTTVQGAYYPLSVGTTYCANLIRMGETVKVELYEIAEEGSVLVFEDALPCDWQSFDRFHVAYDYYGAGYCRWDPIDQEIDCLSNRSTSFIEYSIDCVTVCDIGPTATERSTWGSVKALFR
jgi:hypothetical protein